MRDIYQSYNLIPKKSLDRTYIRGSKYIDSIATQNLLDFVERSKLLEANEVTIIDHRVFLIDINLEGYFEETLSGWEQINRSILNPVKRLHRKKFVELLEQKLDEVHIEDELFEKTYLNYVRLNVKSYDAIILYTYLLEILCIRHNRVYIAEENVNQLNLEYSLTLNQYYEIILNNLNNKGSNKNLTSIGTILKLLRKISVFHKVEL